MVMPYGAEALSQALTELMRLALYFSASALVGIAVLFLTLNQTSPVTNRISFTKKSMVKAAEDWLKLPKEAREKP
jgi:hypothetical protein